MSGFEIDDELIRRLADLMAEKGLGEIELAEEGRSLRVSRAGQMVSVAAASAAAPVAAAPAAANAPAAAATASTEGSVTSPMVGTVYTSPEPEAPPYVSVGTTVEEGQTLMIVEAMKVMNAIRAPKAGRVAEIMVTNAQPVEYGEVLMVIT